MSGFKVVVLTWVDAQSIYSKQFFPEEIPDEAIYCASVGFLVKENKDFYFLAGFVWENNQTKYIHIIPKKLVKKLVVLKKVEVLK